MSKILYKNKFWNKIMHVIGQDYINQKQVNITIHILAAVQKVPNFNGNFFLLSS